MKLKPKLFLIIFPTFIVFTIPIYLVTDSFLKGLEEQIKSQLLEESQDIIDKISRIMFERIADIKILSDPQNMLSSQLPIEEKIKFLRLFEKTYKMYDSFSIYDKNGKKIGDTRNTSMDSDASNEPFFKSSIKGEIYYDKVPTKNDLEQSVMGLHQPIIHVSGPTYSENKEISGVVVARFTMGKIAQIASFNEPELKIDLLSSNGYAIYSNYVKTNFLDKNLSDLTVYKKIENDNINSVTMIDPTTKTLYAGVRQSGFLDYSGNDWILIISLPTEKAFGDTIKLRNNLTIAGIALSSILSVLVIVLARTIITPLSKLRNSIMLLEKGKTNVKSDINSDDEIGELARAFNSMSKALNQIIELEKKVAVAESTLKNEKLITIGELSARVAHDLRNPLSVIKNTVNLMKMRYTGIDDKTIEDLSRLDRAITRMTHQIDDVLDYVKPKPLVLSEVFLSKMMHNVVERVTVPAAVKINLPSNDAKIVCDSEKMEIVFINLITNAIQAVNNKGEINVRLTDKDNSVMIEVEDSGPGIQDDILSKIFDPLFTTKQIGTGLGLASCKSIIEKHGGKISVQNNPTVFTMMMPKNPSSYNV